MMKRLASVGNVISFVPVLAIFPALACPSMFSQEFSVLYSFSGPAYAGNGSYADAALPGGLVAGPDGDFYGNAAGGYIGYGYPDGQGAIYRLSPPKEKGGKWTEEVIWRFDASKPEGADPVGVPVFDPEGNLYGVTQSGGGYSDCGSVFELSPPSKPGAAWTETTLHHFWPSAPTPENDACQPESGLIRGPEGTLYGTGYAGEEANNGTSVGDVFKLTPPAKKGGKWNYELIYQFPYPGLGGEWIDSGLTFGPGGLYGTALYGGDLGNGVAGCGVVFKLTSPAKEGDSWTKTDLYTAACRSSDPWGFATDVIFDKLGNLYGTSFYGGSDVNCGEGPGCGTVFELSPGAHGWTEKTLLAFHDERDGAVPCSSLLMDAKGNLYGTTCFGGGEGVCATYTDAPTGCGVVFKLAPPTVKDKAWTETVFHRFADGADGGKPAGALVLDKEGNFYGTAAISADDGGWGTVFKIKP